MCTCTQFVLINYKVSQYSVEQLRGIAMTNCFSSIFNLGQNSKFKRGITPRKIPANMHTFLTTKFHEILFVMSSRRGVALTKKRTNVLTYWRTDGRFINIILSATRNFYYFTMVTSWRNKLLFIHVIFSTKLRPLQPRMLCIRCGWNWPNGSK